MRPDVRHREFAALGWSAVVAGAAGGALFAAAIATTHPPGLRGLYGLIAFVLLLAAWLAAGVYRMNRIVLTDHRLVVGRESFTRADIDAVFGVQPPLLLRPEEQRRVEDLIPLPDDATVRIVGGSWGRRLGTALVLLRDARDGQTLAVFSRHPRALSDALSRWLTAVPDTPEGLVDPDDRTGA